MSTFRHTTDDQAFTHRFARRRLLAGATLISFAIATSACGEQNRSVAGTVVPASSSSPSAQPASPTGPSRGTSLTAEGSAASYRTFATLDVLVAASPLIVVAQLAPTTDVVNMARQSNDPTNADPDLFIVGQAYRATVQRYLKGSGANMLTVVQSEGIVERSTPKTSANIQQARSRSDHIAPRPGTSYVLFLEPLVGFPPGYVTGPGHPWRFQVPSSGKAEPESPATEAARKFPGRPVPEFLADVEALAKLPPGSPLRTPRVVPTQPLRSIGKIPPTATTAPSTRPPATPSVATPGTRAPSAAGTLTLPPGAQPPRP
jgi:hypothetical protein